MKSKQIVLGLFTVILCSTAYSLSPPAPCPKVAGKDAEYKICLLERRVAAMENRIRMDRDRLCNSQYRAENPKWRRDECQPIVLQVSEAPDDRLCVPGGAANATLEFQGIPDFQGGVSYSRYKSGDGVVGGGIMVKVKCSNKVWNIVK